jgi:hypothetical protein
VLIHRVTTEKQCQIENDKDQIANPRQFAEDRGTDRRGRGRSTDQIHVGKNPALLTKWAFF